MPRHIRSAVEAADKPSGLRRPRRRASPRPRILLWTAGLCLAGACAAALLAVPVVVLGVCAAVLVVALFWRSRARRSDGSGLIPNAFVWVALAALILSLGATALRAVIPDGGLPWGQGAAVRAGAHLSTQSDPPTTVAPAPSAATAPAATPAAQTGTATAAPSPQAAAPTTQAAPAPKPASSAPAAPAPAPVTPAPVVSTPAPVASPTPTNGKCSPGQTLPFGLLPSKNC